MPNYHLVILKKPYLEAILSGQKTIESRFSKARPRAFKRVLPGDRLFLKLSSGPVCATAVIAAIKNFEDLKPEKKCEIKRRYNEQIKGSDEYWKSKADCKYGFLVQLKDVHPIHPVRIRKKDWRAWVVLTAKEDFGLLHLCPAGRPSG
jgi:ASC-1-like (ASCH) protein